MGTEKRSTDTLERSRSLAVATAIERRTTPEEQRVLLTWAQALLEISKRPGSSLLKTKAAVMLTIESRAMYPLLKLLMAELKRVGWDERSWTGRLGLGGVLGTLALAGNAGAGIAALGGAVGIPLWVVLGSGGATLGIVVDKLVAANQRSSKAAQNVDK